MAPQVNGWSPENQTVSTTWDNIALLSPHCFMPLLSPALWIQPIHSPVCPWILRKIVVVSSVYFSSPNSNFLSTPIHPPEPWRLSLSSDRMALEPQLCVSKTQVLVVTLLIQILAFWFFFFCSWSYVLFLSCYPFLLLDVALSLSSLSFFPPLFTQ